MRRTSSTSWGAVTRCLALGLLGTGCLAFALLGALYPGPVAAAEPVQPVATFSIVGYDPQTGDLGVAVQSKFFAVGAVVPYAKAGVGAIATQAFANTTYGPHGLEILAAGKSPREVLEALLADDAQADQRQVGIVDAQGRAVAHTGARCLEWAGHASGENFTAQGNILVSQATVDAMARAFRETEGALGEKLMRALEEGQAAGGDSRGRQSAALLIVRERGGYAGFDDRYCDLRVDDHATPIRELRRLFDMWQGWALVIEGYRHTEAQDWEAAFAAGRRAIALDPDKGEPYYHLACYYSKAGMYDEALETLGQAVQRQGDLASRAKTDTDFEPLWSQEAFLAIVKR